MSACNLVNTVTFRCVVSFWKENNSAENEHCINDTYLKPYCDFTYQFEIKCHNISRYLIIFLVLKRFKMTFRIILKNIPRMQALGKK